MIWGYSGYTLMQNVALIWLIVSGKTSFIDIHDDGLPRHEPAQLKRAAL